MLGTKPEGTPWAKVINASLSEFLKTGCLDSLRLGLPQPEVVRLLGGPEAVNQFRINKKQGRYGFILRYGSLQVTCVAGVAESLFLYIPVNGSSIDLPIAFATEEMALNRSVTQISFEQYLSSQNVTYRVNEELAFPGQSCLSVGTCVSVLFDKDHHLVKLYSS